MQKHCQMRPGNGGNIEKNSFLEALSVEFYEQHWFLYVYYLLRAYNIQPSKRLIGNELSYSRFKLKQVLSVRLSNQY